MKKTAKSTTKVKEAGVSASASAGAETAPANKASVTKIPDADAAGRARRAEYLWLKNRVAELEPDNYSKLYFIWQKGSWYRTFGHSAIIFHYDICPKLKRASKLLPDKDYGLRIRGGVVNIRDMDVLEQKLEELGVHKIKGDDRFRIFNLGRKYTAAELEMFEQTRDRENAFINKIVIPGEVFPHLYKLLRQLNEKVYFVVAKSDGFAREILGEELVERVSQLSVNYSLMVQRFQDSGGIDTEEFLHYVIKEMHWVQATMGVANTVRMFEIPKVTQILRDSGKIIREAKSCLGL